MSCWGLRTTYEGPEYPDFLAVGNDHVEFGLTRSADADPEAGVLTWQLAISDVQAALDICRRAGLAVEVLTEQPRPDWSFRIVKVRSPNGILVLLEEQGPA